MSSWSARRHNDTVKLVLHNLFFDKLLRVLRTRVNVRFRINNVGQSLGVLHNLGNIHHSANVDSAVTNEDADSRRLSKDVSFRRVTSCCNLSSSGTSDYAHSFGCSSACLRHALGDVFRRGKSPANEYALVLTCSSGRTFEFRKSYIG